MIIFLVKARVEAMVHESSVSLKKPSASPFSPLFIPHLQPPPSLHSSSPPPSNFSFFISTPLQLLILHLHPPPPFTSYISFFIFHLSSPILHPFSHPSSSMFVIFIRSFLVSFIPFHPPSIFSLTSRVLQTILFFFFFKTQLQ